jgi:hypothetical protein
VKGPFKHKKSLIVVMLQVERNTLLWSYATIKEGKGTAGIRGDGPKGHYGTRKLENASLLRGL